MSEPPFQIYTPYQQLFDLIQSITGSSGSSYTLPAPLQSIADLVTTGSEMLYTTGTDTYTKLSDTTSFGRNNLIQPNQSSAQSYLGVRVGSDVQAYSSVLQGIATTSYLSNDILYATSATSFDTTTSTSFGRSLLAESNASTLRSTLNAIGATGSSSTDNAIAKWDGTDLSTIQNSGVTISDSNVITATGVVCNTINPVNGGNLIVDSSEISENNWAFLSQLNQNVGTTGTVQFSTANIGSVILSSPIIQNSQATTKLYVDNAVSSGLQPIEAARVASTGVLSAIYSSEVFTSTINGAISIDQVSLALNDRIVVKDENGGTGATNGVYYVTTVGDGSNPYQITRATDFDTASQPISANTFIYVSEGTTNAGTQWVLEDTVTTIDTDPVNWNQFGGGQTLTAGNGIDISGNVISVDASSTFLNNPLSFAQGGTNTISFASGSRLVQTNSGNTALQTSSLNPSDVVTLSDTQILTNKTMTGINNIIRATSLATTTNDVIIASSSAPTTGQIIKATSSSTAEWQNLTFTPTVSRTVMVGITGADYNSIASAISAIGTDSRLTPSASSTGAILIQVAPGNYTESNPLVVPPYVTIAGLGGTSPNNVIVTADDETNDLFVLSYAGSVRYIDGRGVTTSGKACFRVSYAPASVPTSSFVNCIARGCPVGFYMNGTSSQFSSIAILTNCNVVSSATSVTSAYLADAGAILVGFNLTSSGFFGGTVGTAYNVTGSNSLMTLYSCDASYSDTALLADSGGELRIIGGNMGSFQNYGLDVGSGDSIARVFSVFFEDNTSTYANQVPVRVQTGADTLEMIGCLLREDLIELSSSVANIIGNFVSLPENTSGTVDVRTQFINEIAVGLPNRGAESVFGEGDSYIIGMVVKRYNANTASYTTITNDVKHIDGTTVAVFPSNTVGDILYIGNENNIPFLGVKINIDTPASPTGCNTSSTDPPVYAVAWEYWNGSSWVAFRTYLTLTDYPYSPYRRDSFRSGNYQMRFEAITNSAASRPIPSTSTFVSSYGPGGTNKWVTSGSPKTAWTQTTIDSVSAYWVRCRLVSVLTTVPTLEQIKLHTNRCEINADGTIEFFGSSRTRVRLDANKSILTNSASNSPANDDIYVSDNINYADQDNRFNNGVTDSVSGRYRLPTQICTSCPTMFIWRWMPLDGNAGNVRWTIYWAYTRPYAIDTGDASTIYSTTASAPTNAVTSQYITFDVPTPAVTNKLIDTWCLIDVSDMVHSYNSLTAGVGDLMHFTISRDGSADTYDGNVVLIDFSVTCVASYFGATVGNS